MRGRNPDQPRRYGLRDQSRGDHPFPDPLDAVGRRLPRPDAIGTTDGRDLLTALNTPTFAISGAQGWVQAMITSMNINLLTETTPAAFRVPFRSAPHNLYTTTAGLRADADARDYEDLPPTGPVWEFGDMPATQHPPTQSTSISSGPVSTGRGTRQPDLVAQYRRGGIELAQ